MNVRNDMNGPTAGDGAGRPAGRTPLIAGLLAQAERTARFRDDADPVAAIAAREQVQEVLLPLLPELREQAGLPAVAGPEARHAGRALARDAGQRARTAPLPVYTFCNGPLASAPPIVRACVARLLHLHPDAQVLDEAAARALVDIPRPVADALARGCSAPFADYVRAAVLDAHGGIWVDATVYAPRPLPSAVRPLLRGGVLFPRWTHRQIGTWFIAAVPGTPVIRLQHLALRAWWTSRDDLPDDFLFHRIFEVLDRHVPEFRAQWGAVPFVSAAACHALQAAMMQPWHPDLRELLSPLRPLAPVQKLCDTGDTAPPGSVLERIEQGRAL